MKLVPFKSAIACERGFGLNQLLLALIVLGAAFHYGQPYFTDVSNEARMKATQTASGAQELFKPVFLAPEAKSNH